jgi:hypothetical protein
MDFCSIHHCSLHRHEAGYCAISRVCNIFEIHQSNICVTNAHVLQCRLPYRDLCLQLPEAKFRQFLSKTLEVLFDLMGSYHTLMTWQKHSEVYAFYYYNNVNQIAGVVCIDLQSGG